VQLPNAIIGDSITVFNDASGNTLVIYPPTSGQINNLAANAGINLGNNTLVNLIKITSTRWLADLSA